QTVGGDSAKILPALAKLLADDNSGVRLSVIQILGRHGAPGLNLLVETATKDKDSNVRQQALWTLQYNVQGDLKPAMPAVVKLLKKQKHPEVRATAIQQVANCGEQGRADVRYLLAALKDKSTSVRGAAVSTLGSLRGAASEVVPALTRALKDENVNVRVNAVHALHNIGPEGL